MNLNSEIRNLTFNLEEDLCDLKGENDFWLSFNTNQISKIEKDLNSIKIYIDLDLSILIKRADF